MIKDDPDSFDLSHSSSLNEGADSFISNHQDQHPPEQLPSPELNLQADAVPLPPSVELPPNPELALPTYPVPPTDPKAKGKKVTTPTPEEGGKTRRKLTKKAKEAAKEEPKAPPKHEISEEERRNILRQYSRILRSARPVLKDDDAKRIKRAFALAMEAHAGVRRKSGELYIFHPLEVARIVVEEMSLGATSIICALLHDVVEDTEWELKDIEEQFGVKVRKIIDGLTKIKGVTIESDSSEQAENYKKMLLTISEDIRVVLVKIADRLHNMRTLDSMTREKQMKIKSETEFIYAPLAHRLGLYTIKSELEDLCLKFTDGETYTDIVKKIKRTEPARNRFVKEFVKPIEDALRKHNLTFAIKHRVKSIHSIYNKIKKQDVTFDEVYDLFAIRIIIDSPPEREKQDCWSAYSIVTDFYQPNPSRLRDWVSLPKANGYESLHTTVMSPIGQWVEVQIRTVRMDEIAERGLAAHWKYKQYRAGGMSIEQGIEEWLKRVRETLENKDIGALEFVEDFRRNLFNEEVFVFTPRGELRTFPSGATVLDFAFDIHSEVGAHCVAAKVNKKLVPHNYPLRNGDQVEILTSSKPKANEGWLKFVTTTKARLKIKEYLKEERRKVISEGKEIIYRKLRQMKIDPAPQIYAQMVAYFNLRSEPELFYQVGKGMIDHKLIKKFNDPSLKAKPAVGGPATELPKPKPVKPNNEYLMIGGLNDSIKYELSKCCEPIPGDEIFGVTTTSKGIKIHRANCPNASNIMAKFGNRIVRVKWANETVEEFDANIRVVGSDRMGLVSDVTRLISAQLRVNIVALSFDTRAGVFEGNITLAVRDSDQLEKMIAELNNIDGVVSVTRYHL
jgi:GTP diphosphokinase / guanosine-3',5'-bis(diphosphate) 3'-diphosphatase